MVVTLSELQALEPLAQVPVEDLARLIEHGYGREYEPGAVVFEPGSYAFAGLLVVKGRLSVHVVSPSEVREVGRIGVGEVAGEAAFFDAGAVHTVKVVADHPTKVLVITQQLLRNARGSHALAAMQSHTVRVMAQRIRRTNANLRALWEEHSDTPEDFQDALRESIR